MSENEGFEVIALGTGNSFSTKRYCTSIVLRAGGATVLIDCPEPLFRMCSEASRRSGRPIDIESIDHVILTHLHGDHCNGLEGFGFWRKFNAERKSRPTIHTSHAVADLLWRRLSAPMAEAELEPGAPTTRYELADYFDVKPFGFGESFQVEGIDILTRRTHHYVPCFGLLAEFGGRRFGYSCDTTFEAEHVAFLEPADLIFHECDEGYHTSLEDLEALPEATRAKMRLVHLNDDFNGSSKVEAAEDGQLYRV